MLAASALVTLLDRVRGAVPPVRDEVSLGLSRFRNAEGGMASEGGSRNCFSGVGGPDSPRTTVVGRKRDAITIRWLRKELIVEYRLYRIYYMVTRGRWWW